MFKTLALFFSLVALSACGSSPARPEANASPIGKWEISIGRSAPDGIPLGTVTASTSALALGECGTYLESISTSSGVCGSATSPGALSTTGVGTLKPAMFVIGANSKTMANAETVYVVLVENNVEPAEFDWFLGGSAIYDQADSEIVGTLGCQVPESFGNPAFVADCTAWQNVPFSAAYSGPN